MHHVDSKISSGHCVDCRKFYFIEQLNTYHKISIEKYLRNREGYIPFDSFLKLILGVRPFVEVGLDLRNIEDLCLVGEQLGSLALPLNASKSSDVLQFGINNQRFL